MAAGNSSEIASPLWPSVFAVPILHRNQLVTKLPAVRKNHSALTVDRLAEFQLENVSLQHRVHGPCSDGRKFLKVFFLVIPDGLHQLQVVGIGGALLAVLDTGPFIRRRISPAAVDTNECRLLVRRNPGRTFKLHKQEQVKNPPFVSPRGNKLSTNLSESCHGFPDEGKQRPAPEYRSDVPRLVPLQGWVGFVFLIWWQNG